MYSIFRPLIPPLALISSTPYVCVFSAETDDTAKGPEKAPMKAILIGPLDDWSVPVADDDEAQAVKPIAATSRKAHVPAGTFLHTQSSTRGEPLIVASHNSATSGRQFKGDPRVDRRTRTN